MVDLAPGNVCGGDRDAFVTGLNHLYSNYLLQSLSEPRFYTTESAKTHDADSPADNGELRRKDSVTGEVVAYGSNGEVAQFDGIARIEEGLSRGKPNLIGGEFYKSNHPNCPKPFTDAKIFAIQSGKDIDQAWDSSGGRPLICGVCCSAKLFGGGGGYHVVVISDHQDGKGGKTSNHEYYLNNSSGKVLQRLGNRGWLSLCRQFWCRPSTR